MAGREAVFFDLDGTLYDKTGLVRRMICDALLHGRLQEGGSYRPFSCLKLLHLERRTRHSLAGIDTGTIGYDTLFRKMARSCRFSVNQIETWYHEWYMKTMVKELHDHYQSNRSVLAAADKFHREGAKLAVLSDYGCVREKLEALNIHPEMFDALLDSPSLGGYKPAASVFRAACAVLGVNPENCAMVGDRADIDGGCIQIGMEFFPVEQFDGKQ